MKLRILKRKRPSCNCYENGQNNLLILGLSAFVILKTMMTERAFIFNSEEVI